MHKNTVYSSTFPFLAVAKRIYEVALMDAIVEIEFHEDNFEAIKQQ